LGGRTDVSVWEERERERERGGEVYLGLLMVSSFALFCLGESFLLAVFLLLDERQRGERGGGGGIAPVQEVHT
jgi:hypothetical protein